MRYLGNKTKLVSVIDAKIKSRGIKYRSLFDMFSGTASVAKHFKERGVKVFSSDIMYYSYVIQKAHIANNQELSFQNFGKLLDKFNNYSLLKKTRLELALDFLNNPTSLDSDGFIYNNYTPGGTASLEQPRMYFSDENGQRIDTIRKNIETWYKLGLVTENEYFYLLSSLVQSISFFANTTGVFAAFRKEWDPRALKPFAVKYYPPTLNDVENKCFNKNSIELINEVEADIYYLDPPYNQRQYAPNYHILETIAKYDSPEIKGVSGMRGYSDQKSDFCNKAKALDSLNKIAKEGRYKHLILSYNTEGIMSVEDISSTLQKYGKLELESISYSRYKSNDRTKANDLKELLFFLEKK